MGGFFRGRLVWLPLVACLALTPQIALGNSALPITEAQARGSGSGHPWQGGRGDVNLYSLNKQTAIRLMGWTARGGQQVGLSLYHNSQGRVSDPYIGAKWLQSNDVEIQVWTVHDVPKAAVVWGDGTIQMFAKNPSWASTDGYRDSLSEDGGGYDLTLRRQTVLHFGPVFPISKVIRRYRLESITEPGGSVINYQYDGLNRLVSVNDPDGRSIFFSYSSTRLLSATFSAPGGYLRSYNFAYDGLNRLIRIDLPPVTTDSGIQNYDLEFSYDVGGNIASVTDQENNIWNYGYSGDRIAYEQWPINSPAERVLYSISGTQRTITDPRGNMTTYEYDGLSRLVRTRNASFFDVFFDFNDIDYSYGVSRVLLPLGTQYQYDYDARGNIVGYTDAANERWDYLYDARNNLIRAQEPLVTDIYGVTDPARHRTDYAYDAFDRLIQRNDYTGLASFVTTTYQYDASGNLISVTNPQPATWTYQYDSYSNLVRAVAPSGRDIEWFYDTSQQSVGFTQPNAWEDGAGVRTDLLYDEWGRLRTRDYIAEPDQTYSYDGVSRLIRTVDGTGQTNFNYDSRGWLIGSNKGPWVCGYGYYANGLRSNFFDNSGTGPHSIQYSYDANNRLINLMDGGMPNNYVYDAEDRLISKQLGNGATATYTYVQGRMQSVTQRDILNATIHSSTYLYQDNGRLKQTNQSGSLVRYDYDMLNRLVREERTAVPAYNYTYAYDSVGNRIQKNLGGILTTYQYDPDRLLIQSTPQGMSPELYQYDARGRLIQAVRSNNTLQFQFGYTQQGNVSQIQRWTGSVYEPYANYQYDGLGRRVARQSYLPGAIPNETSQSFFDVFIEIRLDSYLQGNPNHSTMTWANGLQRRKFLTTSADMWSATDGFGSMRAWTQTNGQDGGYRTVFDYFGNTKLQQGSAVSNAWAADAGAKSDGDIGLIYANMRLNMSCVGRNFPNGNVEADDQSSAFYDPYTGLSVPTGPNVYIPQGWPSEPMPWTRDPMLDGMGVRSDCMPSTMQADLCTPYGTFTTTFAVQPEFTFATMGPTPLDMDKYNTAPLGWDEQTLLETLKDLRKRRDYDKAHGNKGGAYFKAKIMLVQKAMGVTETGR